MIVLKIAFRNIFRQKRRTVFTILSMFGGFVLAALFIGMADGTYNQIINKFTRNQMGHIQIHEKTFLDRPSLYKTINNFKKIDKELQNIDEIDSLCPRLYSAGLASVKEKSTGVRIIGIDSKRENETTQFNNKIIKGRGFSDIDSHEVIIGKTLAKILKAGLNDEVVIVSQGADGSIANDLYKVIGILETGDDITDRISFYLNLKDAQELLVLEGKVHEIAITIKKLSNVYKVNNIVEEKINNPQLSVEPWQVFAKSFYLAMKADKEGMWIMLLIIVLVVAVGVLNTVLMAVLERQREYGVLKAIGTKPFQIFKQVVLEVNILAIFCMIFGIGVAFFINSFFSTHAIATFKDIAYGGMKFNSMYAEINARSFYIPAITVFLAANLVSIFPALKAAKTEPAKSMRIH